LALTIANFVSPASADECGKIGDTTYTCDDPASPECWFNPTRSEWACSPRGAVHCAALNRSYSCQTGTQCLGDGSAPPYCSDPARLPHRRIAPSHRLLVSLRPPPRRAPPALSFASAR
jgi:hypothetical protein